MDSLFNNKTLLESLYKMAQTVPAVEAAKHRNVALRIIDRLKLELAPVKANSDPTYADLTDLSSLKTWAINNMVTYNGKNIGDIGDISNIDTSVLSAFLLDLRAKSADPIISHKIDSLIQQANEAHSLKLEEHHNPPTTTQGIIAPGTITPVATPTGTVAPEAASGAKPPAIDKDLYSTAYTLLDGLTLNIIEILTKEVAILRIVRTTGSELYDSMLQIYNSTQIYNQQLLAKTSNVPIVLHGPPNNIRNEISNWNKRNEQLKLTEKDLSIISGIYKSLSDYIGYFLTQLKSIPNFSSIGQELEAQITHAKNYSTHFHTADGNFASDYQRSSRLAGGRQ